MLPISGIFDQLPSAAEFGLSPNVSARFQPVPVIQALSDMTKIPPIRTS